MNLNTCYTILGIAPDADPTQAKRAYKSRVKRWHPDRFPDGSAAQSDAEERLKQINIAYARVKAHLASVGPATAAAPSAPFRPAGRPSRPDPAPGPTKPSRSWVDHLFTMLSAFSGGRPDPARSPSRPPASERQKSFDQVLNETAGTVSASTRPRRDDKPASGTGSHRAAHGYRRQTGSGAIGGIRPIEPIKPVRRVRGIGKSR
jgi:hypothetical protein